MPEKKQGPLRPEELTLTTRDGVPYEVTPEGSLGLLALGYKGLMAWRAARRKKATGQDKPARP
ncbi:MAG: hypothetical protein ABI599_15860 [Flavobacteriales bacterium]